MPESAASTQNTAIRHEFAEVNGVRLHYASAGAGKLILFLHGFPEFWYAWKNQLAHFGRDFFAVAPDQRGYNLSSKPAEVRSYEVKFLVEDVRALARHLGHERFILVGHDWGGVVAWAFAAQYPQNLEKLVIINAPHPAIFARLLRENPVQQQASQYMLMFRSPQAEQILSANNYSFLAEKVMGFKHERFAALFNEEDRKAYLEAWSQPGALTGGLNYYRAALVGPPVDGFAVTHEVDGFAVTRTIDPESIGAVTRKSDQFTSFTIAVPTLVIWGEKDLALPPCNLDGLGEFVLDLHIRRIADGTHWLIHERPAIVNSLLRDFIQNSPDG